MMKRFLPLLAAWIMLLCACDVQQSVGTQPPEGAAVQPTESASTALPTPSPSAQPAHTALPASASPEVSYEVILPGGPLPRTEYEPRSTPPRRYEKIMHTLIPQPDYGRIWPYIGGFVTEMWNLGELYGICDDAGQIICDPVYNQAQIIERDGKRLYHLTKNIADKEWNNVSKMTLARTDGSWVHAYDDVLYECGELEIVQNRFVQWRGKVTYEYITVSENGKWGVIDYEGNEILPCRYNAPVCFSEGLAAVLSDDSKTYVFIDKTGSTVLGPFETPPQQTDPTDYSGRGSLPFNHGILFCEGLARFYENGKYGVIDRAGTVIVPAQYDFISSFRNGFALYISDWMNGILDADGKVLLAPTESDVYQDADGVITLSNSKGVFALDPGTGEQKRLVREDENPRVISQGSKGAAIWSGSATLSFPEANCAVYLENGTFALSMRDNTWKIIDQNGDFVAGPFAGRAEYFSDGFLYVYNGVSSLNYGYESRYITLYDQTGKRLLNDLYRGIVPLDGRYLVRQDYCSGLIDESGNWIIKVWLYDYIPD